MSKLDEDIIKRIMDFPEEVTHTDVGKELGVCRQTVSRYRKGVGEALEGKKEKKKEKKKLTREEKRLAKEEQEKQELVRTYSPDELRDILSHLQTHTNKSIDKVI